MSLKKWLFFFIYIYTCTAPLHADPWFTGPLLMDAAEVVPIGHANLELYGLSSRNFGLYQKDFAFVSTPRYSSEDISPQFTYGLAKDFDVEIDLVYIKNQNEGQSSSNIGDTLMIVGYQVLTQGDSNKRSNIRLAVREIFPTGHYNNLSPNLYTTDGTGTGSYQTSLEMIIQHLLPLNNNHFLNLSGSVILTATSTVHLQGLSIYGGSPETNGYMSPGNQISIDLSAEYSITQNWVAVMETYLYSQQASSFKGIIANDLPSYLNKTAASRNVIHTKHSKSISFNRIMPSQYNIGGPQGIGSANVTQLTIAPALEYNFSETIGIIGGTWFTLKGANTPAFITSMIEISFSW